MTHKSERMQVGALVWITPFDCERRFHGIVVTNDESKTICAQVTERDPVWFDCVVSSSEGTITRTKPSENGAAELALTWGVSELDEPIRCSKCGTKNTLTRLDSGVCWSCVMQASPPREWKFDPPLT